MALGRDWHIYIYDVKSSRVRAKLVSMLVFFSPRFFYVVFKFKPYLFDYFPNPTTNLLALISLVNDPITIHAIARCCFFMTNFSDFISKPYNVSKRIYLFNLEEVLDIYSFVVHINLASNKTYQSTAAVS
ncbi:hypothetical protein GYH30_051286 [Glycine max]|uniref:Uncharacterized protein n=1 Tax=Glycine max TaxID=3847 RepID=A0A0R0F5B5_SOYBN|nr:hypothetical protein GYH30_051286 [Glycine max]